MASDLVNEFNDRSTAKSSPGAALDEQPRIYMPNYNSSALSFRHILKTGDVTTYPKEMDEENQTVDWKKDDEFNRTMTKLKDNVTEAVVNDPEMQKLLEKDQWTQEDRVSWEEKLGEKVSQEVDKIPALDTYRLTLDEGIETRLDGLQEELTNAEKDISDDPVMKTIWKKPGFTNADVSYLETRSTEIYKEHPHLDNYIKTGGDPNTLQEELNKVNQTLDDDPDLRALNEAHDKKYGKDSEWSDEDAEEYNTLRKQKYEEAVARSPALSKFLKEETKHDPGLAETDPAHLNKVSDDMKNGTHKVTVKCEELALIKGAVMQDVEDGVLPKKSDTDDVTGNKKYAANYYYVADHSNSDPDNPKPGGHAYVVSPVTGNVFETTADPSEGQSTYRKATDPKHGFKDTVAGKPAVYVDKDGDKSIYGGADSSGDQDIIKAREEAIERGEFDKLNTLGFGEDDKSTQKQSYQKLYKQDSYRERKQELLQKLDASRYSFYARDKDKPYARTDFQSAAGEATEKESVITTFDKNGQETGAILASDLEGKKVLIQDIRDESGQSTGKLNIGVLDTKENFTIDAEQMGSVPNKIYEGATPAVKPEAPQVKAPAPENPSNQFLEM